MAVTIDQAISAAVLGLIGSSHCVGMCGPMVMALGVSKEARNRWGPSIAWQITRATGYGVLGAMFGGLAATVDHLKSTGALRLSAILGGAVMLLVGMRSLWLAFGAGKGPERTGPWNRWINQFSAGFRQLLESGGLSLGAGLGVATAFFPCGLLYAAYGQAAASGHPLSGALIMVIFALSSAPALVLVSATARILGGGPERRRSLQIAGAMLLVGMGSYTVTSSCLRATRQGSACCDEAPKAP